MVDQGTGSTFTALADRGLVNVQWHRDNVHGQGVPHLRMTTNGRKLARSWTGAKVYKAPPVGTLKEWHWRALAKAYAAGDEGLEGEYGVYEHIGERTWQRLLEYQSRRPGRRRTTGGQHGLVPMGARSAAACHRSWARAVRAGMVALPRVVSRHRGA
jgi:hypothetical protein